MQLSLSQLAAALDAVAESMAKSDSSFEAFIHTGNDWESGEAEWYLQLAYAQLIVLAEVLALPGLRRELVRAQEEAIKDPLAVERTPDGDPYAKWLGPARRARAVVQSTFLTEPSQTVTKDLETILREATYSITDPAVFGTTPGDENDVHLRLEAILRCLFPDLLHKPALSKPIKNFIPDTGIPSISTLIEYKFINDPSQVPAVADQVLADTRGYSSKDWHSFLYVIYETGRYRAESQWRQLLRASDVASNTSLIVLTGSDRASRGRKGRQR